MDSRNSNIRATWSNYRGTLCSFPGPLAARTAAKPVPAGSRQHTRDNLRIGTYEQNNCNRRPRGKTSQYKCVSYDKRRNKSKATAWKDGRSFTIGRYDHEIEAAHAADRKNYELNGEFAYLNFPEEIEKNVTTETQRTQRGTQVDVG